MGWKHDLYDTDTTTSTFAIRPGLTTIWCGILSNSNLMLMFNLPWANYLMLHVNHMERKQFLGVMPPAEANPKSNSVDRVDWNVYVQYNDPYHLAGTFMEDGMTNNAANVTLPDSTLYLTLQIELVNHMPNLRRAIYRQSDGSSRLTDREIAELDIRVTAEPVYSYSEPVKFIADEILALCRHFNIPNPEVYIPQLTEESFRPIQFHSVGVRLPPRWERGISHDNISFFYNKKIPVWTWTPKGAWHCLYFFPPSLNLLMRNLAPDSIRAERKIRRERNARRLRFPPFHSRQQLKKFNRFQRALAVSPPIESDNILVGATVQVTTPRVKLERIIVGSCFLTALFFFAMLVAGTW
jgi:hypothetical protein